LHSLLPALRPRVKFVCVASPPSLLPALRPRVKFVCVASPPSDPSSGRQLTRSFCSASLPFLPSLVLSLASLSRSRFQLQQEQPSQQQYASRQPPHRKYFPGHRSGPAQYGQVCVPLPLPPLPPPLPRLCSHSVSQPWGSSEQSWDSSEHSR
jgi:hypothetical protein